MDDQEQPPKMPRRKFLKLASLGAMGATAAACSPGTVEPPEAGETPDKGSGWTAVRTKRPTQTATTPETQIAAPTKTLEPTPSVELKLEPLFQAEIIDGVEVYGVKEGFEIKTLQDLQVFYHMRDREFREQHSIEDAWSENIQEAQLQKTEERQRLWPKKRMLEVAVRRSAWDEFVRRQNDENEDPEFRISFPTWIQCHIDLLNRCMEEAQPPCELEAVLSRIIVVEDEAVTKQPGEEDTQKWDEEAWNENEGEGKALDLWWLKYSTYVGTFLQPADIDTTWAIPIDYRRKNQLEESSLLGAFWTVETGSDGAIKLNDLAVSHPEDRFQFPPRNDTLSQQNTINLDFAMIHEWMHRLLSGPDECCCNIEQQNPSPYEQFHVVTGNNFQNPEMSPFLSYFLNANWKIPHRRNLSAEAATDFSQRPDKISLAFNRHDPEHLVSSVEITKIRVEGISYYDGKNYFPDDPDQVIQPILDETGHAENTLTMDENLFDDQPLTGANDWLIKTTLEDGTNKWLILPASAFMMTKFQAEFDGKECKQATYDITFLPDSAGESQSHNKLELETIHKDQVRDFINSETERTPHAMMEITGTDFYFVWLIKEKK